MLATDEKVAKKYKKYLKVAVSAKNRKHAVYCITAQGTRSATPCCVPERVDKLLREDDWLDIACKKYRLPNKELLNLRKTWSLGAAEFVSDNQKAQMCFREMESLLLKRMRGTYMPQADKNLLPWFDISTMDNSSPSNVFIAANTSAGKSFFLNQLLVNVDKNGDNWATQRPIVCFSLHPEDPSLAPSRKFHGKRWMDVDMDMLDSRLTINSIKPGTLVIFDDVLELPRSDPRRDNLYALLNRLATAGRHRKGKKGNEVRGNEICIITHYGNNRDLATARNSCKYFCIFPNTSRSQAIHLLRTRLDYSKKGIEKLLDRCGESRFACFRMHWPLMVVSKNHVELLH